MTAGVLALGACTPEPGKRGATIPPPSPKPVSVQGYRTALADALGPLDSALRELTGAKTYKGLNGRVTTVQKDAARAAAGLGRLTPPAEVAAEHPRLVSALRRFGGELDALGTDVGDRDLCTGSAVRAGLGRSEATTALRDAMAPLLARLPGERITLALPRARSVSAHRPANGEFIRSAGRGGRGTLTIDNGGSGDAVVTLARHGRPTVSVYVREGRTYRVTGVRDGTYTIFFTGGTAWDRKARAFARHCSFRRFDDPMSFRTVRTGTLIRWRTWKITLEPVVGGNASTSDVDPGDFPAD